MEILLVGLNIEKKSGGNYHNISFSFLSSIIMTGVNIIDLSEALRRIKKKQVCVFISHQKEDTKQCEKIAKYLISVGIDVYFDEYDKDLKIAVQKDDPKKVVDAIKVGIKNSTHMLCIISPNTLVSKWVPFEVGYGYDITKVMVLTLKGIRNADLPHYIRAVPIIRSIKDLNLFIEKQKGKTVLELKNYDNYYSSNHPLYNSMDSNITIK